MLQLHAQKGLSYDAYPLSNIDIVNVDFCLEVGSIDLVSDQFINFAESIVVVSLAGLKDDISCTVHTPDQRIVSNTRAVWKALVVTVIS